MSEVNKDEECNPTIYRRALWQQLLSFSCFPNDAHGSNNVLSLLEKIFFHECIFQETGNLKKKNDRSSTVAILKIRSNMVAVCN